MKTTGDGARNYNGLTRNKAGIRDAVEGSLKVQP